MRRGVERLSCILKRGEIMQNVNKELQEGKVEGKTLKKGLSMAKNEKERVTRGKERMDK